MPVRSDEHAHYSTGKPVAGSLPGVAFATSMLGLTTPTPLAIALGLLRGGSLDGWTSQRLRVAVTPKHTTPTPCWRQI